MADNNKTTDKEKRDNFVKYSNIRLKNAIKAIELLGNLANTRAYKYDQGDVNIIKRELKSATDKMASAFASKNKSLSDGKFIR
tara:strand:- start:325 stop:573 length:249 start_codon:yes stop_codon:yes gene_type:complete